MLLILLSIFYKLLFSFYMDLLFPYLIPVLFIQIVYDFYKDYKALPSF